MPFCRICNGHYFERSAWQHQCPPVWEVRAEDEPDEWRGVRAATADEAACIFVQNRDSFGEYGRVIDHMAVLVRPQYSEEEGERYEVTGEIVPRYDAEHRPAPVVS